MKKRIKMLLSALGVSCLGGVALLTTQLTDPTPIVVHAEGESEETLSTVIVEKATHGTIKASITSGNVGDICVVNAQADLLYKIEFVKMNGIALAESETTRGEYSFPLVAGENVITVSFIVDEELCGEFSDIVGEAADKDWTRLFSVENVVTIVKWILDGGILIALIRYYVKDKKLEKKLENKVQSTINEIIPETTKNTVVATVESVITPIFTQLEADNVEIRKALSIFSKCMALSQENTPESRKAIIDELSELKISDCKTLDEVKKYIDNVIAEHEKAYREALDAIAKISENNKAIIGTTENVEVKEEEETKEAKETEENTYDGTSI